MACLPWREWGEVQGQIPALARIEALSLASFAQIRYAQVMINFAYSAPAELYAAHGRAGLRYRRFSKAAEAIRYAVEKLPGEALPTTSIEVDDERYNAKLIRALYENEGYPLIRK